MGMLSFSAIVLHFALAHQDSIFHRKAEHALSLICSMCSIGLLCTVMGYVNNEVIGGYPSFISAMRPANLYFGSWIAAIASLNLVIITIFGIDHKLWMFTLVANLVIVWSSGKLHLACISDNIDDDDDISFSLTDTKADDDDDDSLSDESTTCQHVFATLILSSFASIVSLVTLGILAVFSYISLNKMQAGVSTLLLLINISQVVVSSFGASPATSNYQYFDDNLTVFLDRTTRVDCTLGRAHAKGGADFTIATVLYW